MNILFRRWYVTTQKLTWLEFKNGLSKQRKVTEDANKADKVLVMTCNGFSLLEERSLKWLKIMKES